VDPHVNPHSGIRIDHIPVEGTGGLIFAVGMMALTVLAVPSIWPLIAFCLVGGVVFAPLFHYTGH
jgi:hypothetical protein